MSTKLASIEQADRMLMMYDNACRALELCVDIDDAKMYSDQSDALATWAKIYKHDEAGRQARQLRLKAHRRMGELARALADKTGSRKGRIGGRPPGALTILQEHGLTRHQADAACHLAKIHGEEFETIIEQEIPPAPTTVTRRLRNLDTQTPWKFLLERPRTPFNCSTYIANTDPVQLADQLLRDEIPVAVKKAEDLIKWLRDFQIALGSK